jgi:hypothetical protein
LTVSTERKNTASKSREPASAADIPFQENDIASTAYARVSGTGETKVPSLWFRDVANRSRWAQHQRWLMALKITCIYVSTSSYPNYLHRCFQPGLGSLYRGKLGLRFVETGSQCWI